MKKVIGYFAIMISACLMLACESEKVDIVKNGTLFDYTNTTIGKAFDGSFGDGQWEYFETPKGVKGVTFKGKIDEAFLEYLSKEVNVRTACHALPKKYPILSWGCRDADRIMWGATWNDTLKMVPLYKYYSTKYEKDQLGILTALPDPGSEIFAEFILNASDETKFEMGYFGLVNSTIEIAKEITLEELLGFIYSTHVYSPFDQTVITKIDNELQSQKQQSQQKSPKGVQTIIGIYEGGECGDLCFVSIKLEDGSSYPLTGGFADSTIQIGDRVEVQYAEESFFFEPAGEVITRETIQTAKKI